MIGCSLYRFYDSNDALLYVGITSVGPERWREHEDHRAWWAKVARTTVEHFPTRDAATTAERTAIRTERPMHNVRLNSPEKPARRAIYRKHGEGTIHQRTDGTGRWMIAMTIPADGAQPAHRFQTTLKDENEARLLLAVLNYRDVRPAVRDRAIGILQAGRDWRP